MMAGIMSAGGALVAVPIKEIKAIFLAKKTMTLHGGKKFIFAAKIGDFFCKTA
jgi:hypothetical protein